MPLRVVMESKVNVWTTMVSCEKREKDNRVKRIRK